MHVGQADIVTRVDLQAALPSVDQALPLIAPLAHELGAAAAAIQWWPRDDGGTGVSVSLTVITRPERGESAEHAIRRAARPVLVRFGVPEKRLKIPLRSDRGPHVDAHHLQFDGYQVDGIYVGTGSQILVRDATGLDPTGPDARPYHVQLGEFGAAYVTRLHTTAAAGDLVEAIAVALRLAAAAGAIHLEVTPAEVPAGHRRYDVALVAVLPARDGVDPAAGLREAATAAAARVGLDAGALPTVRGLTSGPVAVLDAGGGTVYARAGRDPFNHTDPPESLDSSPTVPG
jgi:hypothetical protein